MRTHHFIDLAAGCLGRGFTSGPNPRISRIREVMVAAAASLVLALPLAIADEPAVATLRVGTVGASPGDLVRVPVRMDSNDLVGAFDAHFEAAGSSLESIDYNGPLFLTSWGAFDDAPASLVNVSAACTFPEDQIVADDAPLFDLLVRVPEDAAFGSTIEVSIPQAQIWNYSFTDFAVTVFPGSIVIESGACAEDLDGSGAIEFGDVLAVLGSWGPCACAADLDGDGVAGLSDLVSVLAAFGADCG